MADILGDRDPAVPDRPTRVAEPSRESQLPKRFYRDVTVEVVDGVHSVLLDGKPVRTPGKHLLSVDRPSIAEALKAEWEAQGERIDPVTMPLTRLVNTALDGVAIDMQAVREDIIRYAGSDLICYRADGPEELIDRQTELWDPLVEWAQTALGARLVLVEGVMHVAQTPESIAAFGVHVVSIADPVRLAALHVATSITGSAILAMALAKGDRSLEEAWTIAHVDEDWNIEKWGEDAEAAATRAARLRDMTAAALVLESSDG